jgi:tetratricopeptide (TPR) repeat protein
VERKVVQKALARCISACLSLFLGILAVVTAPTLVGAEGIVIHNRARLIPRTQKTHIDPGGPVVGDILNNHYFPGLMDYHKGQYQGAVTQMDYMIVNQRYTSRHPRQAEILSNAHYIRGMVYFYHASGRGRHVLAKKDFEESIRWNPKNYLTYIELSRLLSEISLKEEAISVLKRLLELQPEENVVRQAKKELSQLQAAK